MIERNLQIIRDFLLENSFQFFNSDSFEKYAYIKFLPNGELSVLEKFFPDFEKYWSVNEDSQLILWDSEMNESDVFDLTENERGIYFLGHSVRQNFSINLCLWPSDLNDLKVVDFFENRRINLLETASDYSQQTQRTQIIDLLTQNFTIDGQKNGRFYAIPRNELILGIENFQGVYYSVEAPVDSREYLTPKLLVHFAGSKTENFGNCRDNYIVDDFKSLSASIAKNTFILRIADSNLLNGSFYFNTVNFPDFEDKIQLLIRKVAVENHIPLENVVCFGTSRGATGALYHGLLGNYPIVSMEPIINREPFVLKKDYHLMFDFIPVSFKEMIAEKLRSTKLKRNQITVISSEVIRITYPYLVELDTSLFDLKLLKMILEDDQIEYTNVPLGSLQHGDFIWHNVPLMLATINNYLYKFDMENGE